MKIITNDANETSIFAYKLAQIIPDEVKTILLDGTLGSGKTTFVKGFGKGLGIERNINSPTFTILKIYEGMKKLYHFDFYRLTNIGYDYDFSEYIGVDDGITIIEWPFNVLELLPENYLLIKINILDDEKRELLLTTVGYDSEWMNKLWKQY